MTRWNLLKNTLAAAMLCGLMLSPGLWLTVRSYPLVPVWDGLPRVPPPWDWLILGVLLAALGAVIAGRKPRLAMLVFVILAGLWSLWDQTRWQPWFYQYLFMFAVLAIGPPPDDPKRAQASLNACRLIVASIYVWSGLQKANKSFVDSHNIKDLIGPALRGMAPAWQSFICDRGWEMAFAECCIGLGLLVWPLRPIAIVGALGMHSLLLYCLGPWGLNWNSVVWPWNLAMMAFVVILFGRTRGVMPWHILWPRGFPFARVTLLLFGVMPLLNFFECWDAYLSAALYSNNTADARIFVSQDVYRRLYVPLSEEPYPFSEDDPASACPYELDLLTWSMAEMNVPPYPADRVSRGIARRLAELPRDADPTKPGPRVVLILESRADWRTGERRRSIEMFP